MQMVIHHREPTDRHREDFGKFLQASIDQFFTTVEIPFPEQEGAADTARHAVIPTSQRNIDEVSAGDRPRLGSWGGRFDGEWKRLTDVAETDLDTSGDLDPRMSSVYKLATSIPG